MWENTDYMGETYFYGFLFQAKKKAQWRIFYFIIYLDPLLGLLSAGFYLSIPICWFTPQMLIAPGTGGKLGVAAFPRGWQEPNHLSIVCCLSGFTLAGTWRQEVEAGSSSGTGRTNTCSFWGFLFACSWAGFLTLLSFLDSFNFNEA